jgi:hypothetical protein
MKAMLQSARGDRKTHLAKAFILLQRRKLHEGWWWRLGDVGVVEKQTDARRLDCLVADAPCSDG